MVYSIMYICLNYWKWFWGSMKPVSTCHGPKFKYCLGAVEVYGSIRTQHANVCELLTRFPVN